MNWITSHAVPHIVWRRERAIGIEKLSITRLEAMYKEIYRIVPTMRDRKELKMSRKLFRPFASLVLALAITFTGAGHALAAPPANDTFTGATLVSVGFSEVLDTTEATTDSDDAQLNTICGAPATDASVWYALEGTDIGVIVDVSQSDYSAGVAVGVGTQGNLQLVTCGPGAVVFFAAAGETYYVLAFD